MTELLLLYKREQNKEGDTFCSNSAILYYCCCTNRNRIRKVIRSAVTVPYCITLCHRKGPNVHGKEGIVTQTSSYMSKYFKLHVSAHLQNSRHQAVRQKGKIIQA